jgi:hypothetical protein
MFTGAQLAALVRQMQQTAKAAFRPATAANHLVMFRTYLAFSASTLVWPTWIQLQLQSVCMYNF